MVHEKESGRAEGTGPVNLLTFLPVALFLFFPLLHKYRNKNELDGATKCHW